MLLCVRMLPANTTALLQPCDQGLLLSAKAQGRRQLETLNLAPVGDIVKNVPVIDVIRHMGRGPVLYLRSRADWSSEESMVGLKRASGRRIETKARRGQ